MIFRILKKKGKEEIEQESRGRKMWVNFIGLMLHMAIDPNNFNSNNGGGREESEVYGRFAKEYKASNAMAKLSEVVACTRNNVDNPITFEDIELLLWEFTEDSSNYQISNVVKKTLVEFDPDAGYNKEKSASRGIFEKKLGLFATAFQFYFKTKQDEMFKKKNATSYINQDKYNEDSSDGKRSKGLDPNSRELSVEMEDELGEIEEVEYIAVKMYEKFFENEDRAKVKRMLILMYNMYLKVELRERNKDGQVRYGLFDNSKVGLNQGDLKAIGRLIDKKCTIDIENAGKSNEFAMFLLDVLNGRDPEKKGLIATFFCLMIKSRISLREYGCPYFEDVENMRWAIVNDLNGFESMMENTKLSGSKYSEFTLLKNKGLEIKTGDYKAKITKKKFNESIKLNLKDKETESKVPKISENLMLYFEEVIRTWSEEPQRDIREIVLGLNKYTIKKEDINIIRQLIEGKEGEQDLTEREKLMRLTEFYRLMKNDQTIALGNREELLEVIKLNLQKAVTGEIQLESTGDAVRNTARIANFWKLVEKCSRELLVLEPSLCEAPNCFGENIKYGVAYVDLFGEHLPIVRRSNGMSYVRVMERSNLVIKNVELSEGEFDYNGQIIRISNKEGAQIRNIMEDRLKREIQAELNIDSRYSTDSIDRFLNSETPLVDRRVKNKEKLSKTIEGVQIQNEDLYEMFKNNDLEDF